MEVAITSSVEEIAHHAEIHPESIAIVLNGRTVTYQAFYLDIAKMVMALRLLGLQQGQSVGVESSNTYMHWLILLGFDALGIATLSYDHTELAYIADTLADMDMIMCPSGKTPVRFKRIHHTDQDWLNSIVSLKPELPIIPACRDPDAPFRIVKSSGTTGQLKIMIHTRAVHEARLLRSHEKIRFTPESRYLVAMGFSVQAFHLDATACVRAGGLCVFEVRQPLHKALSMHAITDVLLLPSIVISMLDEIKETDARAPQLRIYVLGGSVSKQVHERVGALMGGRLFESYGTNESGAVCRMDPDGAGTIVRGAEIQTVDENDMPVTGTPGSVRIKSASLVSGYLNNPVATRKMFRNGWFYPGDIGLVEKDGRLRIIGREDDLLNIGGIKFLPTTLEEKLLAELPVRDICISVLEDNEGVSKVWVAVVPKDSRSQKDIHDQLAALLPSSFSAVKLAALEAIPRTATGKIRRAALNQTLKALQQAR